MEHTLITPRTLVLSRKGIPLRRIHHLVRNGDWCDANLRTPYGHDSEVDDINRLQKLVGDITPELMDLRVAADCCCIWRYDYPERVHDICAAIGGSPHTALRLHYQVSPQRRQMLAGYAKALSGWLRGADSNDADVYAPQERETARRVYTMLGAADTVKKMLAERTYYGLSSRALNCSFWGHTTRESETNLSPCTAATLPHAWRSRMADLEHAVRKELGRAAGDFLCDVGGTAEPACHFKFMRRIDILISSIGCGVWRGNLPPKDETVSGRRNITRRYLGALENYWTGSKSQPADAAARTLAAELGDLLGTPDDAKRWLVASLWKNIKNQTEHHAYPMQRWVEFVRIGEQYLSGVTS